MGHFQTIPIDEGGGGAFRPLAWIQKWQLNSPCMSFPNILQKIIWTLLMTSQIRSSVRFVCCLSTLASRGRSAVSDWNTADDTAWIVSGIFLGPPKPLVISCKVNVLRGHQIKKVSVRSWRCDTWFRPVFVKNAKINIEYLLTTQIRQNLKIRKMLKPPGTALRAFWFHLKWPNWAVFRYRLEILYRYSLWSVISHMVFLNGIFLGNFWKIFLQLFFIIWKKMKSEIAAW